MSQWMSQQLFNQAVAHHQAGRIREAEQVYRQILSQQPNHPDALHLLGVVATQAGQHTASVELIRQAISLRPNFSEAYSNLSIPLKELKRYDEAIEACLKSIEIKPSASAYSNLGNALKDKGDTQEAIAAYRQAIELNPNHAEAYSNLGNALTEEGQVDEAITACQKALQLHPQYAIAFNNLGNALREKGRLDDAMVAFEEAIRLAPGFYEAHSNYGNVLRDKGHLNEAVEAYRKAVALSPKYAIAHSNLGNALRDVRQLDEAIESYRAALALEPNMAAPLNNLAGVLKDTGEVEAAVDAYRKVLAQLKPGPLAMSIHSNICYSLEFHPAVSNAEISAEARRWAQIYAEPFKKEIRPWSNDRDPERKLKIGYVSPDFRNHAESFFVVPLLEGHDHDRYEIHCYASVKRPEETTERIKKATDHWHDVLGWTDQAVAEQVRSDGIDVLVDLTMHMADSRLPVFARKPAPVQVTWLAYPGTTGLSAIDCRISDAFMDRPDDDISHYAEETVRLPGCWICYHPLTNIPAVPQRDLAGGTPVTFGSFNNPCKLNVPLLTLWADVMKEVPGSRLMLLVRSKGHRERIEKLFEERGVERSRLEFTDLKPREEYLRLYDRVDIALDPLPYNGITTTGDALWMGVPVVSLAGTTPASRAGDAMLTLLGLPELVAHNREDFIRMTAALARDFPRLAELRRTLRTRMEASPIMDNKGYARTLEAAYREMWRRFCKG